MNTAELAAAIKPAVSTLPSGFMLDGATYAKGAELGFEGMDFYVGGRGGVLGDVSADVVTATFVRYRSGRDATWRATCSDGRLFVIDLMDGNDWAASVINCEDTVEQKARCEP